MNGRFKSDPWRVIEQGFDNKNNRISESVMSLSNGHFGMRGNFEESFSGNSLKGSYIAGVYYPDKTKVGWWKIGYPEYFAKVLNACDFASIRVEADGEPMDLMTCEIQNFSRVLDMRNGTLARTVVLLTKTGKRLELNALRFLSMDKREIGAIRYSIACDQNIHIKLTSALNGDVRNADANDGDVFWEKDAAASDETIATVAMRTKKTDFLTAVSKQDALIVNGRPGPEAEQINDGNLYVGHACDIKLKAGGMLTLIKYISVTTSRDYPEDAVIGESIKKAKEAFETGFEALLDAHERAWARIWDACDIEIYGDVQAQQAVRFCIFQLNQTYTGHDARLNIGPKGFTGEKYGGSTYWDTEVFCLPFYLSAAPPEVAKQLLVYRYQHLDKAKENAAKLGMPGALYPMVTMNGEECHNEWEITFEEIHRNAAITLAIKNYIDYTGDTGYIAEYGIDVLVETARYWRGRVAYQPDKNIYMILGVTGPNEYENNVNNNWYTNTMAAFSLRFTVEMLDMLKQTNRTAYDDAAGRLRISADEAAAFTDIADHMFFPYLDGADVFGQQDGFSDKAPMAAKDVPPDERPVCQHWSWDRILRSPLIKQADVLQGIFNFPHQYDIQTKRRNFDYYEPMTVHESSLSPCVHAVIAAEIGDMERAYALFLRASRLDLDDFNNDTQDGLHITSTAGAWLAVVHGFGGLRVKDDTLIINPKLPELWDAYSFRIRFRRAKLTVTVEKNRVVVDYYAGGHEAVVIDDNRYVLDGYDRIEINR